MFLKYCLVTVVLPESTETISEKREGDHRGLTLKGIPPTDLNMSHSTENATCPYTFDRRKSPSGRVLSDTLTEKAWKEATQVQ